MNDASYRISLAIDTCRYWKDISECECASTLPKGACPKCDMNTIIENLHIVDKNIADSASAVPSLVEGDLVSIYYAMPRTYTDKYGIYAKVVRVFRDKGFASGVAVRLRLGWFGRLTLDYAMLAPYKLVTEQKH